MQLEDAFGNTATREDQRVFGVELTLPEPGVITGSSAWSVDCAVLTRNITSNLGKLVLDELFAGLGIQDNVAFDVRVANVFVGLDFVQTSNAFSIVSGVMHSISVLESPTDSYSLTHIVH